MVYVVDDDEWLRDALARLLRSAGHEVQAFGTAGEFVATSLPDEACCLVLDVRLPGSSGLDFQDELARSGNQLPIIFMTGHGDIPMSVRAIKAGAVDFLTKPVASETLLAAVRAAIADEAAGRQVDAEAAELARRFGLLTEREREVLAALVAGKLNKQIANDLGVVEQTVKFHRARIMERMQARTVAELMHMAAKLRVGSDVAEASTPKKAARGRPG